MRIFGQPTRPSMASRGDSIMRGGPYRPGGVRDDPVTGAPILPGTQPPPWTARPRPGTAAGGAPDRLPTRPRPRIQREASYLVDPREEARKRYAEAMMQYVGKAAPHSSRYYGRYGGEATKDYIAAQIGAAPVYDYTRPMPQRKKKLVPTGKFSVNFRGYKMPIYARET